MSPSLVSVIVPSFNRAHCLPMAVDSALAQTHQDIEIVIIDDGSTDNTRGLIEERYGADSRVRYVCQENSGVAVARNHAIELAQGEYIAFLDSDDAWDTWKIELQVTCMASDPELVMVWSDMRGRAPDGQITEPRYLRKMYSAYGYFTNETLFSKSRLLSEIVPALSEHVGAATFRSGDLYPAMIAGSLVHTSTVLLKRTIANRIGKFNSHYRTGEDYDFHIRTCKAGTAGLVDLPTVTYQLGMPDRLTRSEMRLLTAQNFLEVVTRELQTDSDRINLSDRMKRAVLADAHRWIGYELLGYNDTARARAHFTSSLRYSPWQPNTLRLLLMSCLPARAFAGARQRFRRIRGISPAVDPTAPVQGANL